jgi:hypothetical protein
MRNNLDDVLRKNKFSTSDIPKIPVSNQKVTSIPQVCQLLKNPQPNKFKPAVAAPSSSSDTSISQAVKVSSAKFPSFSTPGFGKFMPNTIQADATRAPRTREVVSISSDSTPSSPHSIKRTSSDPSVTFETFPQSSKRIKKACLADKENLFQPNLHAKSKSKARTPTYPSRINRAECRDDDAGRILELDSERNPSAKLDRDFPSRSLSVSCPKGLILDHDSDLLSVCNPP